MTPLRDLLKHSSVYMIGQILTRMASVLLLPFYTHYLSPADYGVIAILDLTGAILGTMICDGMLSAVTRHHFDREDAEHHDAVWWTGFTVVLCLAAVVLLPMWAGRQVLSGATLGYELTAGPWFLTLTLATIVAGVPAALFESYLRVEKRSVVFVTTSLARLLINVGLNVWFLAVLRLGIEGLLVGNLLATVLHSVMLAPFFLRSRRRVRLSGRLAAAMLRYNAPLVVTAILAMLMHEADRYFLRIWQTLEQVGVYSLAHKIGFAVNTLCLLSFSSIWHVAIYDIERMPHARQTFAQVYGWFTSGLGILLLGAALTIHPVLPWLTPDTYSGAADLVSVVLLGFFVFGLSYMFEVPALLSKCTRLLIPGSVAGLVVNVVANVVLIPRIGAWGAAWAGVLTYAAFSLTILWCCRSVMQVPYPWKRSVLTTTGFCTTYVVLRYACFPQLGPLTQIGVSVLVCAAWTLLLFGRDAMEWWSSRSETAVAISDETMSDLVMDTEEQYCPEMPEAVSC